MLDTIQNYCKSKGGEVVLREVDSLWVLFVRSSDGEEELGKGNNIVAAIIGAATKLGWVDRL